MSAPATHASPTAPGDLFPTGRVFVNAPFDYLVIGGGLSLLTFAALLGSGGLLQPSFATLAIPFLALALNSAHFAASTVRLYTKPGSFADWPFLTMGLPLLTLAVLSVAILWPEAIGTNLTALYLTWSPFHYAAQAFGLACMYHYRSGGTLSVTERRLLYATCLLPFLYSFFFAQGAGLAWFLPESWLTSAPSLAHAFPGLRLSFAVFVFAAPVALATLRVAKGERGLPLISWLIIVANGAWWVVFTYFEAFVWATIFHGLQYLAIVMIFHVRDHSAQANNRRAPRVLTLRFYGASLALGFLLFNVWPFAYLFAGFGLAESMLLCAAVINIHHFIVDRYIWRLRKDSNNQVAMRR